MMNSTSKPPRLLTVPDVAALLKVSVRTVRRWIKGGALHVHQIGRQHRIAEEDLTLFLAKNRK